MATHGVVGISRRGGAMRGLLKSGLVRHGQGRDFAVGRGSLGRCVALYG